MNKESAEDAFWPLVSCIIITKQYQATYHLIDTFSYRNKEVLLYRNNTIPSNQLSLVSEIIEAFQSSNIFYSFTIESKFISILYIRLNGV